MKQKIAKASFYSVAVGMFLFTAYMTLTFVSAVLPDAPLLVQMATLLVFDGGMLAWMVVFTSYAQGTTQRATAIVTCVFDFIGVGLMVAAEVAIASSLATDLPLESWATWAVAGWTFVNVGALLVFHLSDPETQKEMASQSRRDKLTELAHKLVDEDLDSMALNLAEQIKQRELNEMLNDMNLVNNAPKRMISANAEPADEATLPAKPSIMAAESPVAMPVVEGGENFTRPQAGK